MAAVWSLKLLTNVFVCAEPKDIQFIFIDDIKTVNIPIWEATTSDLFWCFCLKNRNWYISCANFIILSTNSLNLHPERAGLSKVWSDASLISLVSYGIKWSDRPAGQTWACCLRLAHVILHDFWVLSLTFAAIWSCQHAKLPSADLKQFEQQYKMVSFVSNLL